MTRPSELLHTLTNDDVQMSSSFGGGGGGSNVLVNDYFNDDTELLIHSDTSSPSRTHAATASEMAVTAVSPLLSPWLCRQPPLAVTSPFLQTPPHQPHQLPAVVRPGGGGGGGSKQQRRVRTASTSAAFLHNKMQAFASPQLIVTDESQRPVVFRNLNYPAIQSLRLEQVGQWRMFE